METMKRQSIPLIKHFSALIKVDTFNGDSQKTSRTSRTSRDGPKKD